MLKWDKLYLKNESAIWVVITGWIETDRANRLQYLPMLIKECLRFGRLSETYIRDSIFASDPFMALPFDSQRDTIEFMNSVLHGESRAKTITDGRELLYAKSISYFRPRETKHFLLAAGGWTEGRTSGSIELYDYQLNLWLSTEIKLPASVSYFGLEILDNMLFVFGGSNGREIFKAMSSLDLTKPDPKWMTKCSMIQRRCYVSSVVLDGQLYAFGGFNEHRRIRKCVGSRLQISTIPAQMHLPLLTMVAFILLVASMIQTLSNRLKYITRKEITGYW